MVIDEAGCSMQHNAAEAEEAGLWLQNTFKHRITADCCWSSLITADLHWSLLIITVSVSIDHDDELKINLFAYVIRHMWQMSPMAKRPFCRNRQEFMSPIVSISGPTYIETYTVHWITLDFLQGMDFLSEPKIYSLPGVTLCVLAQFWCWNAILQCNALFYCFISSTTAFWPPISMWVPAMCIHTIQLIFIHIYVGNSLLSLTTFTFRFYFSSYSGCVHPPTDPHHSTDLYIYAYVTPYLLLSLSLSTITFHFTRICFHF